MEIQDAEALKKLLKEETAAIRNSKSDDEGKDYLWGMVTLPSSVASLVNIGYGYIKPRLRQKGEEWIRDYGEPVLKLALQDAKAQEVASKTANVAGWAFTFAEPIVGAGRSFGWRQEQIKELKKTLAPVAHAYGLKNARGLLAGDKLKSNEIFRVEKTRINEKFKLSLREEVVAKSVETLPHIAIKVEDNKRFGTKRAKQQPVTEMDQWLEKCEVAEESIRKQLEKKNIMPDSPQYRQRFNQFWKSYERGDFNPQDGESTGKRMGDDGYDMLMNFGPLVGSFLAEGMRKSFQSKYKKNDRYKETALDKISHLYEQSERKGRVDTIDGKRLEDYIEGIFQLHQKNMGELEIGERMGEDLHHAAKEIAGRITAGDLHPMALVDLVGERQIVRKGGKSIASRAEVKEALDKETDRMPAHYSIDPDKYLAEATFTLEDMQEILGSMEGEMRDFYISLFPQEVLEKAGVSQEESDQVHQRMKQRYGEMLRLSILDMASQPDEELQQAGLTEKEITMLRDTAKEAQSPTEGVKSVLAAVSTHGEFKKGVEWAVVNDADYWRNLAQKPSFAWGNAYGGRAQIAWRGRRRERDSRRGEVV